MEPALWPGDWLLVWRGLPNGHLARPMQLRSAARAGGPARAIRIKPGQVVVARHPEHPDLLLVKRAARREPGGWWLESDNTDVNAIDSRQFGLVPPELIEGRVLTRYWPAGRRNAGPGRMVHPARPR